MTFEPKVNDLRKSTHNKWQIQRPFKLYQRSKVRGTSTSVVNVRV